MLWVIRQTPLQMYGGIPGMVTGAKVAGMVVLWYRMTPAGPTCQRSGAIHLVDSSACCRLTVMGLDPLSRWVERVQFALTVAGFAGLDGLVGHGHLRLVLGSIVSCR